MNKPEQIKKEAKLILFRCGIHKKQKFYEVKLKGVESIIQQVYERGRKDEREQTELYKQFPVKTHKIAPVPKWEKTSK